MNERLEDWIDPRHLTANAIAAAAARYAADPFETIWFDAFLRSERLDGLRRLYEGDGVFRTCYGLYDDTVPAGIRHVDERSYRAADPRRQFEVENFLESGPRDRPFATGWLTHLKFMYFCSRPALRGFLARITGIDPMGVHSGQARISGPGHYVGRHTDSGFGRRLTMVLYPGRRWNDSDGGRFRQFLPDGDTRSLAPLPNRLVVFRVSKANWHEVEPVAAGAPPRWGYTVWLGETAGEMSWGSEP